MKDDELWAARYDLRFQKREAGYYDAGLEFVGVDTALGLDAGCGSGAFALPLAGRVRRVVGLDRNAVLLERARARQAEAGIGNVEWVVGDIGRLPFADGAFGFVGSYNVLQVVPAKPALGELERVVGERGRLVARIPLRQGGLWGPLTEVRRVYQAVRRLPEHVRALGVGVSLRMLGQELSREGAALERYRLPPDEVEALLGEALPGGRVVRDAHTAAVFWERGG